MDVPRLIPLQLERPFHEGVDFPFVYQEVKNADGWQTYKNAIYVWWLW